MKYYYILWSDAINWTRSSIRTIGIWKLHTLGIITLAMSFNLGMLCLIIEKIICSKVPIFHLSIEISSSTSIDGFLGATLLFYIPPLILNYYLIFKSKKWDMIRKKYTHKNGKIYKWYVAVSVIIPIWTLLIIGFLFYGYNPFK